MDERFVRTWPDDQRGSAWFTADGYRLFASQPGEFVAVRAPLADVPRELIVSGTFRKLGGPPGGGYGLILADQGSSAGDGRDQSGQFVVAAVGDRGEVGIWRRDGQRWIDLVAWTPSGAVHPDTVANDLTVQLLGGRLTFEVNGQQVADVASGDAPGLRPGSVGIFTGGDLNEVVVSRFRVQAPGRPVGLAQTSSQPPSQLPAAQPMPQSRAESAPPSGPRPPVDAPGGQAAGPEPQRVQALLSGIADDMDGIARSFAGGLDNPHNPVSDPAVLQQDSDRLAAATSKARELQAEMDRLQNGAPGGR